MTSTNAWSCLQRRLRNNQPLQNRVTPFGEIVAHPARGTLMGNRGGRIHDPATKVLLKKRWASKRWISCRLEFKNRRREVMGAGYTELFFLDEANALASGHRPCFECRRQDARRFAECWSRAANLSYIAGADEIDAQLHIERLAIFRGARQSVEESPANDVMIAKDDNAYLCVDGGLRRWSFEGYGPLERFPDRRFHLLTPPSIVAAIKIGYSVN